MGKHKYYALINNDTGKMVKKERGGYTGLLYYWANHASRKNIRLIEIDKNTKNLFMPNQTAWKELKTLG
jgi:hypothetical protein